MFVGSDGLTRPGNSSKTLMQGLRCLSKRLAGFRNGQSDSFGVAMEVFGNFLRATCRVSRWSGSANEMTNEVQPCSEASRNVRPWLFSTSRTNISPMPWPPGFVVKNGLNSLRPVSSGMPGPLSSTMISTGSEEILILISPPLPIASYEFFMILSKTCSN